MGGTFWRGWRSRLAAVAAVAVAVPMLAGAMPPPARTGPVWSPFPLPAPASVPGQPLVPGTGAAAHASALRSAAAQEPAAPRTVTYHPVKHAAWPAAGSAVVPLTSVPASQASGSPARSAAVRHGVPASRAAVFRPAGSLPVAVAGASGASGDLRVSMASHAAASAAGVSGVIMTLGRASGPAGTVQVRLRYGSFSRNDGGAYSSRLRLVELPACAVTTPRRPGCRAERPLRSTNDAASQELSAPVTVPAAAMVTPALSVAPSAAELVSPGAAGGQVIVAATSGPSGPAGDFTATPLKASGTWAAQDGDFTYSYPITVPPSLGGSAPDVSLAYDAQSVDSETSAANTQAGWIGDGWDYSPGFIERSYQPCSKDGIAGSADECWDGYNATLTLNGQTSVLVGSGPGTWHLQNDDGTSVQLKSGAPNGLWNGEYWVVTTTDGTQYYFGRDHLPGGTGSDTATNSAWGVPVYSPGSTDPCYSSASGQASECQMGWRWNLDYVVDPLGNLTAYNYQTETNYYSMGGGQNNGTGTLTPYVRAGFLTQISYGWLLSDALTGTAPAALVKFGSAQRCTGSTSECSSYANLDSADASDWPDVPFDQICGSTGACTNYSPSYFSTYMLTSITTHVREGASYANVDSYTLSQSFPSGSGSNPVIALKSIVHAGKDGGSTAMPALSFVNTEIDNRVDGLSPPAPPVDRPRLTAINTETGSVISVSYNGAACSRVNGTMPAADDSNTMPCFPVYWTPPGLSQIKDWFNKSLVGEVDVADETGAGSPTQVTKYSYLGGAAWHYNDNPLVPAATRTWDQYRGYAQVQETNGASPDPVTQTLTTYMRGMDGDANSDGSMKSVTVSDSLNDSYTDSNWLAGQILETDTYTAAGGTVDRKSVSGPWTYNQTASVSQPGGLPDLTAHMPEQSRTRSLELLTGSTWQTSTSTTYDDGNGQPVTLDLAPAGGPETCTSTLYASAPGGNSMMEDYPAEVTEVTGAASGGTCPAKTAANIVSDTQTFYDDESGTLTSPGTLQSLASPGGLVTEVRKASTWPSGSAEVFQPQSATAYDAYGRVTSSTNADNATTATTYTPAYAAGTSADLPTQVVVKNPMGWKTTTALDEARQLPVKVTDVNSEITTETYDALGRLLTVTAPADQASGDPTYKYAYSVPVTAPSSVTTSTLREDGSYAQDVSIYDGMLQLRQQQQTPANAAAGRLLTDTFYDSHGWVVKTRQPYYDATTSPGTTMDITGDGSIPGWTRTTYDGQGRVTASAFFSDNTQQWQTTTAYPTADETDVTPPAGGTATSTFVNASGQTTATYAYTTATPDGNAPDADVTSYTYTPAGQTATVADNAGNTRTDTYNLLGEKISATDPGATGTAGPSGTAGSTTYAYDASGNLTSQTNPLGQQISYTYDSLGRKTAEYSGSTTGTELAAWSYDKTPLNGGSADALGQPTSSTSYTSGATGPAFTEKVTGYDSAYQATGTSTVIPAVAGSPGGTYSTTSTYTPLTGLLATTAYGADGGLPAETVNYSEDLQGEMLSFGGNAPYLDQSVYTPEGQAERTTFGASGKQLVQTYTDDPATARLLTTTTNLQTLTAAADTTSYTYSPAGNITSVSDAQNTGGTQTQCFTYNNLDQLTTAWTDTGTTTTAAAPSVPGVGGCTHTTPAAASIGGPAPYWETYTYDLLGDRTSEISHNTAGVTADNITQTISYAGAGTTAAAQPDAAARIVTQYGTSGSSDTTTPAYDAAGDTTAQVTTTSGSSPPPAPPAESKITYTPQGQTASVTTAAGTSSYTYDASGNLLVQADPGKVTYFADGGAEQIFYNTSASPATVTADRFYPAQDGTVTVRSSAGVLSYETGNQQGTALESVTASSQAVTRRYFDPYGSPAGTAPASWPDADGFVGRPADPATSLDLLGARQYDAATGRFLSLDPVFEAGDPSQMGGYSYAGSLSAPH